jgi:hypothetical protein
MRTAKATNTTRTYETLKAALGQLGFVRPGSLARRFVRCGKPGCRCMAEPPILHGPYYDWTYKVQGKSVARRLTEAQAQRCAEWLRNHRRLRRIVHKMETLSLKETDRLLQEIAKKPRGD